MPKGHPVLTPEHRAAIAASIRRWHADRLAAGIAPPFTGHKLSPGQRRAMTAGMRRRGWPTGPANPLWKEEGATYGAIHVWARRWMHLTGTCQTCGRMGIRTERSNIDHRYRRVREDWTELCRSCHFRHDIAKGLRPKPPRAQRKARCPMGHPFDPANTYVSRDGGRECRTCRAARRSGKRMVT